MKLTKDHEILPPKVPIALPATVSAEAALWLHGSLIWLVIACLVGLAQSIPSVGILLDQNWIHSSTGRLILARQGALIYGWGISNIIGIIAYVLVLGGGQIGAWLRCLRWLWHGTIVIGISTTLWASGSGLWCMPFASWTFPAILLVLGGITFIIAGSRPSRIGWWTWLPITSAFGMLWGALMGGYWIGGDGVLSSLAMSCIQASISICFLVICITAFARAEEWTSKISWRPISLLLITLSLITPPLLGASALETMPIPWEIVQLSQHVGIATMCILIISSVASLFALIQASKTKKITLASAHWYEAGLLGILMWIAWTMINPWSVDWQQLSIALWYESNLWLYGSIGMLGLAVWLTNGTLQPSKIERFWAFGGLLMIITWGIAVYANINVQQMTVDQQSASLSSWASFIAIFESLSWILLALAALFWWQKSRQTHKQRHPDEHSPRRFSLTRGSLIMLLVGCIGLLAWHYIGILPQPVSSFEVKRPGTHTAGARIFAAEGCGMCHTQIIRALPSGRDLQQSLDQGGNGKGIARISIPEDYEPEANEGAPHIGHSHIGPDLFQLQARVENYVSYIDNKGKLKATATPQEWLFLHLYNPRDKMFGKPWTICPPMPQLFEQRRMLGSHPSPEALPLAAPKGYEIVPKPEAVQLVAYLSTLKRGELTPKIGQENSPRTVNFLKPQYLQKPPILDESKFKAAHAAIAHEQGRQIYSSRCAICHGNDGKGNAFNYPPLKDSEWITGDLKTLALIIRYGLSGAIKVNNKDWNSIMLPTGITQASEIAVLINYIRWQYGKINAPAVTTEQVEEWIQLKKIPESTLTPEQLPSIPATQ